MKQRYYRYMNDIHPSDALTSRIEAEMCRELRRKRKKGPHPLALSLSPPHWSLLPLGSKSCIRALMWSARRTYPHRRLQNRLQRPQPLPASPMRQRTPDWSWR